MRDKNKNLKRNFGITLFQFRNLLKSQNFKCIGCFQQLEVFSERPKKGGNRGINEAVVDHCHSTGVVRGVLCHNCNVAVGHMQDSNEIAHRLAEYLANSDGIPGTVGVNRSGWSRI